MWYFDRALPGTIACIPGPVHGGYDLARTLRATSGHFCTLFFSARTGVVPVEEPRCRFIDEQIAITDRCKPGARFSGTP